MRYRRCNTVSRTYDRFKAQPGYKEGGGTAYRPPTMTQTVTRNLTGASSQKLHRMHDPPNCPAPQLLCPYLTTSKLATFHFHNLASQLDGEWARSNQLGSSSMPIPTTPPPSSALLVQEPMLKFTHMMMRRDVWGYISARVEGSRYKRNLRRPWADPVVKENIIG